VSGSYGLSLTSLDRLAIEVKSRLASASEIEGYRRRVDRVADVGGRLVLVPGCILVTTLRFASTIEASHSNYLAGIGILLPFIEDSEPLADSQPSPPSMVETFIALLETWKTIKVESNSSWTFRGSEGVIFDSPNIEGVDPATSLPMYAYLVVAAWQRVGRSGPA
jgi:hypothetical protein